MPFDAERPAPVGGVKFRTGDSYIIAGSNSQGCCEILELWVEPDRRSRGEGRELVGQVRTWARENDLFPLIVHCSPRNEGGQKFYESIGLRLVAVVYQDDLKSEGEGT